MSTRNETLQEVLSSRLKIVRARGISEDLEDKYLLVQLAQEIADQSANKSARAFRIEELQRLSEWILDNPGLFHETTHNLDRYRVLELIEQPAALGAYLLTVLREEMLYQEPDDAQPDHGLEDDMRERVRDYNLETLGVC